MLKKSFPLPHSIKNLSLVCLFIGALTLLASLFTGELKKVGYAYLVPFIYFFFISIGALFFITVQFVSKARWSANIRRMMESMASFLPYSAVMWVPFILYGAHIYEWWDPAHIEKDPLLKHKEPYLNLYFFLIRLALFFSVWVFFFKKILKFSTLQDQDGKEIWREKSVKYSVAFLLFFVPSFSLLSVDFLMSLDAHWFSTIFGVYTFAGAFQSALAVMILLAVYFMPLSKGLINENHLHDLGKFLMGMTLFWAYIAFSQYMLIWYANLPEETTFFIPRSKEPWMWVSLSLVVFKFAVPFFCLLPRWVKRNKTTISILSIWILIMQYVDIYWLVYPAFSPDRLVLGWLDVGFFMGFFGLFLMVVFSFFQKYSVVPLKDPEEEKSTAHHVTY